MYFFPIRTIFFRPPFINGRPQDLVSVFWKKGHYPPFLSQSVPFSFTSFSFTSFVRGHQESPGVTRGRPGETGGDQARLLGHRSVIYSVKHVIFCAEDVYIFGNIVWKLLSYHAYSSVSNKRVEGITVHLRQFLLNLNSPILNNCPAYDILKNS